MSMQETITDNVASPENVLEHIVLDVRKLSKKYRMTANLAAETRQKNNTSKKESRDFWALRDITFQVRAGERVGIMGHNGAGKSTLLKILSRVVLPTSGEATIIGRPTSLLEVGTGFNQILTGRQNVYINASLFGLTRNEIDERMDAIVEFSEIGRFIDEPVRTYSTGMRSRLGFSVAAHLDPDILMLDEVLSVGDASFQQKCLTRMNDLTGHGRTLLFVSHSTGAVRKFCDRCIWLSHGEVIMDGDVQEVCDAYESQMHGVTATFQAKRKTTKIAPITMNDNNSSADKSQGVLGELADGQVAEIVSAQVLDVNDQPAASIKINQPCSIEFIFDVLKPNLRVEPALHFKNEKGEILFVVAFTDVEYTDAINEVGRYKTIISIPKNLLNEGLHFVTLCLVTADPLTRHHILENAVSFSIYEVIGDTVNVARGRYARTLPGGLRPRLEWKTQKSNA